MAESLLKQDGRLGQLINIGGGPQRVSVAPEMVGPQEVYRRQYYRPALTLLRRRTANAAGAAA